MSSKQNFLDKAYSDDCIQFCREQAQKPWYTNDNFWDKYYDKTKNWGVGPAATMCRDMDVMKKWAEDSEKIWLAEK